MEDEGKTRKKGNVNDNYRGDGNVTSNSKNTDKQDTANIASDTKRKRTYRLEKGKWEKGEKEKRSKVE